VRKLLNEFVPVLPKPHFFLMPDRVTPVTPRTQETLDRRAMPHRVRTDPFDQQPRPAKGSRVHLTGTPAFTNQKRLL